MYTKKDYYNTFSKYLGTIPRKGCRIINSLIGHNKTICGQINNDLCRMLNWAKYARDISIIGKIVITGDILLPQISMRNRK
jgi:hypothetical protein